MADILDGVILPVVAIVFIAFMVFWFLPDKLSPALSEANGSETLLITPFQSCIVGVLIVGALLIIIITVLFSILSKR